MAADIALRLALILLHSLGDTSYKNQSLFTIYVIIFIRHFAFFFFFFRNRNKIAIRSPMNSTAFDV